MRGLRNAKTRGGGSARGNAQERQPRGGVTERPLSSARAGEATRARATALRIIKGRMWLARACAWRRGKQALANP